MKETAKNWQHSEEVWETSERGFSLIEVIVSIGLVSLIFLGVSTLMTYYSLRLTELRSEQELRTEAGAVLSGFAVGESCERQIKNLLGSLPSAIQSLDYDFKYVEYKGQKMTPMGPFPGHAFGRFEGARLHFEGAPLPGQMVIRGQIFIDFRRLNSTTNNNPEANPLRTRSSSFFFALDPQGRVTGCLDNKAYKHVEWSERICNRMSGVWRSNFKCDLSRSEIARRAGCQALGLNYSGVGCAI